MFAKVFETSYGQLLVVKDVVYEDFKHIPILKISFQITNIPNYSDRVIHHEEKFSEDEQERLDEVFETTYTKWAEAYVKAYLNCDDGIFIFMFADTFKLMDEYERV